MSKAQMRAMTARLVSEFKANGGTVTMCEPKARRVFARVGGVAVKPLRMR